MRKERSGEGSSMSEGKTVSPTSNSRRLPLRSRRKLPFSENAKSPQEPDCSEKKAKVTSSLKGTNSSTPRRNTPLSERQQIALLCKLSIDDSASNDSCPPANEENSLKRNERGETALHLATIKGDYEKVLSLLKEGVNVNTTDFAGWTPLHEACNHGQYKVAKLLLDFNADVNVPGLEKYTPLHDAAINRHEEIVELLLSYGANPLQKNANWRTPLDVAGSERIAEILTQAILSQQQKSLIKEAEQLGSSEREGQSETSPCQPISASCELTMRKNSPHNQTHKGADKPTSPRLTLKFHPIRSRNDKSSSSAKVNDISSHPSKYQSYCVTMETKGDVYDFRKEDATVSSTQSVSSTSENEPKCEAVSSTSKDSEENEKEPEESSKTTEKMDTADSVASKVNGGRSSVDSNGKDRETASDAEKEDSRRKRRKSNDSAQSRGKGHKSPSNKSDGQRSPKTRKRGSQSSSDTESNPSDAEPNAVETGAEPPNAFSNTVGPHSPKVPPLKIVIPSGSGSLELETRERSKVSSSKLPYVVNTTTADNIDTNSDTTSVAGDSTKPDVTPVKCNKDDVHQPTEERFQRVTRSSQRMQAAMSGGACQSSEPNVVSSSGQKGENSGESSNEEPMQIDVHPRKRKLRAREAESNSQNPSSASSSSEDSQHQHQQLNSYQMFLNIRKQVDKRRKGMFIVHPKPPQGFKDYLLNRCSYILEGNANNRVSVPMIPPPQSLEGSIKELFIKQEKERYRLRLQHLIEKEKLILAVEQETLRVHGRAARALANQTVPLSVCTILKDEEIYNTLEDDKDKNIRSRYNGRLFISWLQDVDDKWKEVKNSLLLRHHNEAESLHAVQRLDWEWKMKELAMCDFKTSPVIDDIFVPIVYVDDEFNLPSANPAP